MKKQRIFGLAYVGIPIILVLLILSHAPVRSYPIGQNIAAESFMKGLALGRQWKIEEAKEQFEKASKADPSSSDYVCAIISLGVIEDFDDLKEAIHCLKGHDYLLRSFRFPEAFAEFKKAIEINPKYSGAYNKRGLAMWTLGNTKMACSDWKRACELGECDYYRSNCE